MTLDYGSLMDAEEARLAPDVRKGAAPDYGAMMDAEHEFRRQKLAGALAEAARKNPDAYARAVKDGAALGVPPAAVEADPDLARERVLVAQADRLLRDSPTLSARFASPDFARVAHDDTDNLSAVETLLRTLRNAPAAAVAGVPAMSGALAGTGRAGFEAVSKYLTGPLVSALPFRTNDPAAQAADYLRRIQDDAGARAKALRRFEPTSASDVEKGVYSGLQSLTQNVLTLPLAVATRSANAALIPMTTSVFGESYGKARDAQKTVLDSLVYAGADAATEYWTEKWSLGALLKTGAPFVKRALGFAAKEIGGEQAATLLQDMNQWAALNPDKPLSQFVAERPSAAVQTFVATLVGAGGQVAVTKGVEYAAQRFSEQMYLASNAESDAQVLARMAELAKASKHANRDPQSFGEFVQAVADEGPVSELFVDAKTLVATLEQGGLDASTLPESVREQLPEAVVAGGDVSIPVGDFAARIANTDAGRSLLPHLRTSAEAMSQAEAQTFMQSQAEQFRAEAEKILGEQVQNEAFAEQTEAVRKHFADQFAAANRFTPAVNDAYSSILRDFYVTTAKRLGLTPQEMLARYPLRVAAANVAAENVMDQVDGALAADTSPLVNIGLARPDGGQNTPEQVLEALASIGVQVRESAVHQSDTEQTVVAALDRALTPEEADALSVALGQESIAQQADGAGELYGPGAAAWRPFNPQYFLRLDGTRASDPVLEQPAFHGSSHNFKRFSTDKIGTGEGAAAYGWGLYFAENPAIAEGYFERLAGRPEIREMRIGSMVIGPFNGFDYSRRASESDVENARATLAEQLLVNEAALYAAGAGGFRAYALRELDSLVEQYREEWPEGLKAAQALREELEAKGALKIKFGPKRGGVYQVEIPDGAVEMMLDWDKPLSEQAPAVRGVLAKIIAEGERADAAGAEALRRNPNANVEKLKRAVYAAGAAAGKHTGGDTRTGEQLYRALENAFQSDQDASLFLFSQGIPGIKYLDAGSRAFKVHLSTSKGPYSSANFDTSIAANEYAAEKRAEGFTAEVVQDGTRNLIVFSDKLVTITHKDGKPATAGERKTFLQSAVNGGESAVDAAFASAASAAGTAPKLEGLPDAPRMVGGELFVPGPFARAHEAAAAYMRSAGLPYRPVRQFARVDVARAKRIAEAYAAMPHAPNDPEVKAAYDALVAETIAQYRAILATGLRVEFIRGPDPYAASPWAAVKDVRDNNRLFVFSTREGFGSDANFDPSQNPLLAETEFTISGEKALANDIFRVVHDYFGHVKDGVGFRADGEENAWRSHAAMYSPLARRAMTTETRGQNSWVNFGPHGETNRTATAGSTVYADQKTGLLPEWVGEDGRADRTFDQSARPDAAGGGRDGAVVAEDAAPRYGTGRPDAVSVLGVHFSAEVRTSLDGSKFGTGMKSSTAEVLRVNSTRDERLKRRAYFYVPEGSGVTPERGVGGNAHVVKLENLYDAEADPLRLRRRHRDDNAFESAVLDAGFDGYYARGVFGNQGAAVVLDARAIPVAPLEGGLAAVNAALGPVSVPAAKYEPAKLLAIDLANDARLPVQQANGQAWLAALEKAAPDLFARLGTEDRAKIAAVASPMYRDEVTRAFYNQSRQKTIRLYHGTAVAGRSTGAPHDRFDRKLLGSVSGATDAKLGFWFTTSEERATLAASDAKAVRGDGFSADVFSLPVVLKNPLEVADVSKLTPEEVAALARKAKRSGHDAVVFVKGERGGSDYLIFDPDSARADRALDQQARGQISFAADITQSPTVITLLKTADLSTFHHEMGHFFLEVLADIAQRPDAPADVVADFDLALKFMGVESAAKWRAMSLDEKRPFHEKFARGYEAFLFEGEAPTVEQQPLFQRFSAWMKQVYKSLVNLDVKLTPEVRGVYNRLLGSEEQIKLTEQIRNYAPLFASEREAGASPAEWAAYQALHGDATDEAVGELQKRSLADLKWARNARNVRIKQLQREAESKREAIRAEVEAEVRAMPIYVAQGFLSRGELPDADRSNAARRVLETAGMQGTKLNTQALRDLYGDGPAAPWRYLPTGKSGMVAAEGGLTPDQAAELLGFRSGDHLVRELLAAEPMESVIEGMTDQRMLERYGDLTDEGAIQRAADEAVHNELRARVIATELRFLARAANVREKTPGGGTVNVLARAAKEFAEAIVARKKVRDIRPNQFALAEARAAKAALAAKTPAEKAVEKRNQLVNFYGERAARDATAYVDKSLRYLKRFDAEDARKRIDAEYLDQIDALLERFDLRAASGAEVQRRASLAAWVEAQREAGFEPTIDKALIEEAQRQHYSTLTYEAFRGLVDAVKNVEHLGRLKRKLLTAKDEREFAERVGEASDSIRANATKTVPERRASDRGPLVTVSRLFKGFVAEHRKAASLLREMDGFADGGVMWELLVRSMNERGNFEASEREKATIALSKLFAPILKTGGLGKKTDMHGKSWTREERIGIALNAGNAVNKERVMTGERWSPEQFQQMLDTLTPEEADFVQGVWDYLDSFKQQIAAKTKRVAGVEPEWVEGEPVMVGGKLLRGGYYPIKYDPDRSSKSEADDAAAVQRQMERGLYVRAQTRRGHLEARVESTGRPMRYDMAGVIVSHVDQVIHDLAWHEWLIDANRLLRAAPIDSAIREHYGPDILAQLKTVVRDIAVGELSATQSWERVLNHLRHGATIVGLGWNVATSLLQPFGLTQSMVRIGPTWVAKGLAKWLGDAARMESATEAIYAKSEFMRLRAKTMQREVNEIRNQVAGKNSALEASYFWMIATMQKVADIPTWLGAYEKALATEGMTEEKAVALADQAVIDSQGGGQTKDLAAIQRGGPALKLWTNFYSFFNTAYNIAVEQGKLRSREGALGVPKLAVDYVLLLIVPAVLGTLLKEALKYGGDDDEKALAEKLVRDQLNYLFGLMVGLRELGAAVQGFQGYAGPGGTRFFSEFAKLGKQVEQGEVDEAALKAAANVAGTLFHLPTGQVGRTIDGLHAIGTGKTDNPGALIAGFKGN